MHPTIAASPLVMRTTGWADYALLEAAIASGRETVYSPGILRWVFAVMQLLPRAVWRRMPG